MEHPNVFGLIAEAARKADVRLILIGGFAVNAYGVARNTRDIDFLIIDAAYPKLSSVLSDSGYAEDARSSICAKLKPRDLQAMPIDLVFVDENTFETIWKGAFEVTVAGQKFKVPSLMHLIMLKLHAIQKGTKDRVWKDLPDIINLVKENKIDVASPGFIGLCKKFGSDDIYKEIKKMVKES